LLLQSVFIIFQGQLELKNKQGAHMLGFANKKAFEQLKL